MCFKKLFSLCFPRPFCLVCVPGCVCVCVCCVGYGWTGERRCIWLGPGHCGAPGAEWSVCCDPGSSVLWWTGSGLQPGRPLCLRSCRREFRSREMYICKRRVWLTAMLGWELQTHAHRALFLVHPFWPRQLTFCSFSGRLLWRWWLCNSSSGASADFEPCNLWKIPSFWSFFIFRCLWV